MSEKPISSGHSRRDILRFAAASAVGLALPGGISAASGAPVAHDGVSGPLRSAGVLTFGPNNVLFVGVFALVGTTFLTFERAAELRDEIARLEKMLQ